MIFQALARSLAAALLAVLVGAACGGAATSSKSTTEETPNLKGKTIRFVNSAPPDVSDTILYLTVKQLKAWGADASMQNVQGDPNAIRAVLSGQADVAMRSSVAPNVNAGLIAFGPSQPRTDYYLVTTKDIKAVAQLKGHRFAVSNTGGLEATMYHVILAKYKVAESDVPMTISGSAAARVQAMLAGKIDATFAHADGWLDLKDHGFNEVSAVAQDVPDLAAGFWSARSTWIQQNPDLATAIDMAWLKAAHVVRTDRKAFIAAALEYTQSQITDQYAGEYYDVTKPADIWPDDGSGFSDSVLNYNAKIAYDTKATDKNAALADWTNTTYWKQAVKNVLHK